MCIYFSWVWQSNWHIVLHIDLLINYWKGIWFSVRNYFSWEFYVHHFWNIIRRYIRLWKWKPVLRIVDKKVSRTIKIYYLFDVINLFQQAIFWKLAAKCIAFKYLFSISFLPNWRLEAKVDAFFAKYFLRFHKKYFAKYVVYFLER